MAAEPVEEISLQELFRRLTASGNNTKEEIVGVLVQKGFNPADILSVVSDQWTYEGEVILAARAMRDLPVPRRNVVGAVYTTWQRQSPEIRNLLNLVRVFETAGFSAAGVASGLIWLDVGAPTIYTILSLFDETAKKGDRTVVMATAFERYLSAR